LNVSVYNILGPSFLRPPSWVDRGWRVSLSSGRQLPCHRGLAVARRAEALFTDVGEEWLRLHSHALRSHRDNEIRWNRRIKAFFDGVTLAALNSGKVLEFRAKLLADSTLADATRNQYLQELRAILRYAVSTGYLTTSPTDRLRGLLIRVSREKVAPPIERPEDVGRLLGAIRDVAIEQACPSYPALFATAVYTGLRSCPRSCGN
jgi:integrase